jgi:hypothetical protein
MSDRHARYTAELATLDARIEAEPDPDMRSAMRRRRRIVRHALWIERAVLANA